MRNERDVVSRKNTTKVYLAPLENITTLVYRNTLHEMFGESIDAYFMPFMMPHMKIGLDEKDRRELSQEKNKAKNLIPQILTNNAEDFWRMAKDMVELGFREININIGCPSHKVCSKGRGSGLLKRKEQLDQFLYGVFEKNEIGDKNIAVSVKTRLGTECSDDFYELLKIYNQYPLKELIIHPRTGVERYSGTPHQEYFIHALKYSKNPVCYNGDIFTVEDYNGLLHKIEENIPEWKDIPKECMSGIMLGRGLLANPALGREIKGGPKITGQELQTFMNLFRENCKKMPKIGTEKYLINKSKEIWSFMRVLYPRKQEQIQRMLLTNHLEEYLQLEEEFFVQNE